MGEMNEEFTSGTELMTSLQSSIGMCFLFPTCLGGAVDVLYGEGGAQAVQQNLGQRRDELSGGDQDVDAVGPVDGAEPYNTRVRISRWQKTARSCGSWKRREEFFVYPG